MRAIIVILLFVIDIIYCSFTYIIPKEAHGKTLSINCTDLPITISSALYGSDCSNHNLHYDQTSNLAKQCNGLESCKYQIEVGTDPAPNCPKAYVYSYRCGHAKTATLAAEASGKTLSIDCTEGIDIFSAIYGGNCDTSSSQTHNLRNKCNYRSNCSYYVDSQIIGDPDFGCAKTYQYWYQCHNTSYICQPGLNYFIEGNPATAEGDPHFVIWNGNKHNFQGEDNGQYYYMHPCPGSNFYAMPFTLLATHNLWAGNAISLNYITLELYDLYSDQFNWVIYLNSEFLYLADYSYGTVYNSSNIAHFSEFINDANTTIGNGYFQVYYHNNTATKSIDFILYIDGKCSVSLSMQLQLNTPNPTTHFLTVQPPQCYKCFTCGLFGSFQKGQKGISEGTGTLLTCNGGYFQYTINSYTSFPADDYDKNGWTWSKSYVQHNCSDIYDKSPVRRRLQNNVGYIGTNGEYFVDEMDEDFEYATCNLDLISTNITSECELAINNYAECCEVIGANFCDALESWCEFDTCILFQEYDDSLFDVSDFVFDLIVESLEWLCNMPDIGTQYNDDNLIEMDGAPEWYIDTYTEFNTSINIIPTIPTIPITDTQTPQTDKTSFVLCVFSIFIPIIQIVIF